MSFYSIVIPVYKSEDVVTQTVQAIQEVLRKHSLNAEIVLVNDGSPDDSWKVIQKLAESNKNIIAIDLLKNYGQHTAVHCGIANANGDFIITMDDDLQNPPEEILKLISKIDEGYDLVFARFRQKMHGRFRSLGSKFVGYLNTKIFGKPKDLTLTNFRIFTKETAQLMLNYQTNYPYIPGLLLMHASCIANVDTEHHKRESGVSNYTLGRILKLVARLLFNYSSFPLKVMSGAGVIVSLLSFIAGIFYVFRGFLNEESVPGWTTLVVLISFLCGFILAVLGVMGEYLARMMNQMAISQPYLIRKKVG
ncbi:MAG: glycosyltransferase family 2 protein [Cryomorphaceae bacterium]